MRLQAEIKAFLMISAAVVMASCAKKEEPYHSVDGMIWNTTYHIVWQGDEMLRDSILPVLESVGGSLNIFDESSLLSRINNAPDSLKADQHFVSVYRISKRIHEESGGGFDPTLSPLITAWGFGPGHKATSDTMRIDSLLEFTGFEKTRLEGNILYKSDPRIVFNFSAIAKGYGCDCVGRMFERNGVKNYMVEIGGEIACGGKNPEKADWHIQIDRPIRSKGAVHESQAVISLSGKGLATSGNYRNYHEGEGGGEYGHTISAKTGRPVQTDVLSASVVAPNAMQADALATACMATGSEKALRMCKRLNCPVMLILADTVIISPGFRRLIIEK